MRRPRAITLVLIAGAAVTLGACESQEAKCRRARLEGRPDADRVCAAAASSGSSTSSSFVSGGSGNRDAGSSTATTSTRGGFGSTASSHGSSGG